MVYAYWCETKDGSKKTNFMDETYHDFGSTVIRDGVEYVVVDIAEEYPISVSEIYETMQDERWW